MTEARLRAARWRAARNAKRVPLPPDDLIWRVSGLHDRQWFLTSGALSVANIEGALAVVGSSLLDHGRLLDFGCGCGRIIRWMQHIGRRADLIGTDIDAEAVAWAAEHIPWARFICNPAEGPLELPADSIDLVFNHSVFSHIPEDLQDRWLLELRRVVRPGGLVLASVVGARPWRAAVPAWRDLGWDVDSLETQWNDHGHVYITDDMWEGGPFPPFYHSTFHAPWYVLRHWDRFFDVVAYLADAALEYQDIVLMRKREAPVS